jgi:hypothetical protein
VRLRPAGPGDLPPHDDLSPLPCRAEVQAAERADCRINPEALDAFRLEIEAAEVSLAEHWARELLDGDPFEPLPLI